LRSAEFNPSTKILIKEPAGEKPVLEFGNDL